MDEDPDTIEVRFDDKVNVMHDGRAMSVRRGLVFGEWYVTDNVAFRSEHGEWTQPSALPANSRFSVGHNPTGLGLWYGLEFWEAKRIAMAMADANLDVVACMDGDEPDVSLAAEAVIASALMDHYVFPIAGWSL